MIFLGCHEMITEIANAEEPGLRCPMQSYVREVARCLQAAPSLVLGQTCAMRPHRTGLIGVLGPTPNPSSYPMATPDGCLYCHLTMNKLTHLVADLDLTLTLCFYTLNKGWPRKKGPSEVPRGLQCASLHVSL